MKEKINSINSRQAGILVAICLFANKMLLLPSLMFEQTKEDSLFVLIFMFLLDIVVLPIFLNMKRKYPNEKLYNILASKITPFFAKILYIIFLVFFMLKVLLVFSITYVYFKQQIYQEELLFLILISCIPVINHAVCVGLRSLSRSIELLFGVVVGGVILCLFFSLFTNMSMPTFFVSSGKDFLLSVYKNAFSFGDYLLLFILIDKIKINKNEEKKIYAFSLFGILLVVLLFLIFYSKYNVTAFMHNSALADILTFSVQFNAIGRLDILAMVLIMTITLFQLEIFAYCFCDVFSNIFTKFNKNYAVVIFDITFILLYFSSFGKYENLLNSYQYWGPILGIFINYIFPLICLLIVLCKRKVKK